MSNLESQQAARRYEQATNRLWDIKNAKGKPPTWYYQAVLKVREKFSMGNDYDPVPVKEEVRPN